MDKSIDPNELLSVDEVLAVLKISRTTYYRLVHANILNPIYVAGGHRPLIRVSEVRAEIANAKQRGRL